MIEELFAVLEEAGANAGPEELVEILWLAARIDGGGLHMSGYPQDATHGWSTPPPHTPVSSTPDASDSRPAEQFYSAADMADSPTAALRSVDLVRIRRAASLRDPLAVMRALRPFGRPASLPADLTWSELDEELTVRSTVEQCVPIPVFRPHRGRWLNLALVVDAHHSMLLWHDLVSELRRVFVHTGIFRDVRTWHLSGTGAQETPRVARAGGEPRSVHEVADPSGHQLVLVVTDTVAGGWSTSSVQDVLRHWAGHNPVALLNVLPRRLWDRGALQPQPHLVRAPRPAVPNSSWRLGHAAASRRQRPRAALAESIAIPVIEASPDSISTLAQLVGGGGLWSRLPCLPLSRLPDSPRAPQPNPPAPHLGLPVTADESLRRFRADASPLAQTLAGYLSAVPLNLPVMNLVRQIMLPQSDPGHLAEVALGGLFEPWEHESQAGRADMERMPFRFRAGVREALLGSQRRDEVTAVQELVRREIGAFVSERGSGPAGDFLAARGTAGGDGSRTLAQDALPFADRTSTPSPVERPVREVLAPHEEYLRRSVDQGDVDAQLREAVHRAVNGASSLVLLIGEAGSGKTTAIARALQQIPTDWRVWSPDLSLTLTQGAAGIGPRTVVVLDDVEQYTALPDFTIDALARVVSELLENTAGAPVLVLGTMAPATWASLVTTAAGGSVGDYEDWRRLSAQAEVISLSDYRAEPVQWTDEPSERIVMIASMTDPVRAGSKINHMGTGFLLGPRLVLTAAHVLARASRNRTGSVKVRRRGGRITGDGWVDCRVLWTSDTHEAALLLATDDLTAPTVDSYFSIPRWARLAGNEPLSPCQIASTVTDKALPRASRRMAGALYATSSRPREGHYEFEPTEPLPQLRDRNTLLRGLSGAPVFFEEFFLGFAVAVETRHTDRPRLTVASLSSLADDPGFIEACRQYMRHIPRLEYLLDSNNDAIPPLETPSPESVRVTDPAPERTVDPTQVHALIVGVEHYAAGLTWNLPGPARDAVRFYQLLRAAGVPETQLRLHLAPLPPYIPEVPYQPADYATLRNVLVNELSRAPGGILWVWWGGLGVIDRGAQLRLYCADATAVDGLVIGLDAVLSLYESDAVPALGEQLWIVDASASSREGLTFPEQHSKDVRSGSRRTFTHRQTVLRAAGPFDPARPTGGLLSDVLLKLLADRADTLPALPDPEELFPTVRARLAALREGARTLQYPDIQLRSPDRTEVLPATVRASQPTPDQRRVPPLQRAIEALLAYPFMADPAEREILVGSLPPAVTATIPRHTTTRLDALSILNSLSRQHPDALWELFGVVRSLDADPTREHELEAALRELLEHEGASLPGRATKPPQWPN